MNISLTNTIMGLRFAYMRAERGMTDSDGVAMLNVIPIDVWRPLETTSEPVIEDLSTIQDDEIPTMTALYMSLFNADNTRLIQQGRIDKGRTIDEGLWDEEPWTMEKTETRIRSWLESDDIWGVVVRCTNESGQPEIVGAAILSRVLIEEMQRKGLPVPDGITFDAAMYVKDLFRRMVNVDGRPVKGLGRKLLDAILQKARSIGDGNIIVGARTFNPYMSTLLEKSGWCLTTVPNRKGSGFPGIIAACTVLEE